jgi:hypothetical protein
LLQPPQLNHF